MWVRSLDREDTLEGMAAPSSIPAWRIPWTEKPGRLQSRGSQRVGHNWIDLACTLKLIPIYILFSSELSQVGTWNKWINLPFIWRNGVCVHKERYHGGSQLTHLKGINPSMEGSIQRRDTGSKTYSCCDFWRKYYHPKLIIPRTSELLSTVTIINPYSQNVLN